jgi:predicted lactoylglutathione lyase
MSPSSPLQNQTACSKSFDDGHAAALIALSRESRAAVDAFVEAALANGGSEPKAPSDLGFMYQRTVADPDGNLFEPFWMDPAAV